MVSLFFIARKSTSIKLYICDILGVTRKIFLKQLISEREGRLMGKNSLGRTLVILFSVIGMIYIIGAIGDALEPKCIKSGCNNTQASGSSYCYLHKPYASSPSSNTSSSYSNKSSSNSVSSAGGTSSKSSSKSRNANSTSYSNKKKNTQEEIDFDGLNE